ncbi:hypothetical protein SASPL_154905 [Salvia splendens]|uniref:Peptidase A1 domain-containing protein n=1 Tax=Salvia splendens TaxID=180675 RepID=A0A8X8YZ50_SALSN|nr:hypothetical protein SASPL_154905 [Salvia splendens]
MASPSPSPSLSLSLTSSILLSLILISTSSSDHQFELLDLHQPPQLSSPTTHHQPHSPPLSLTLHPRSSLHPPTANYTALTLSRLACDQARVHSLLLRHSLALSATSAPDFSPQELQSPVISGIRLGSGEYFARLGVGRPAKNFYMVLDSGSDVTWLQCRPCAACYNQSDPIFNPSTSSTYRPLPCAAPQCSALDTSACRTNACLYQRNPTSFSYCLVNRDSASSSTLDFNSPRPADSVLAPLLANPRVKTYRYIALSGIDVGGRPVNFSPSLLSIGRDGRGGVIIDSGTAVTRLRSEVYGAVRDAFAGMARGLPAAGGFSLFDTCYDLSGMARARVPTVALRFEGGKTVALRPSNFLIPVDEGGKYCFAFAATSGSLSIIGNVQQQGTRVSYDLANKVVGFSPNKC